MFAPTTSKPVFSLPATTTTTTAVTQPSHPAHLPHPLTLPEILSLILSHLPISDLAQCLSLSSTFFHCAVQRLYKSMRVIDLLRLVEAGRRQGGVRLGQFHVTLYDITRLRKYTPHITILTLTSQEFRNRSVRHIWKTSGRSYAQVPLDPLDQLSQLVASWHDLLLLHPELSPALLAQGHDPSLRCMFPKLRALGGSFGLDDELALTSLDFTLPVTPSSLLNGLAQPWQAAYTYNQERELRGVELLLRVETAYAGLSAPLTYFFFFLRQSTTLRECEIAAVWQAEAEQLDWHAIWNKEESGTPFPEKRIRLRKLVLRAPRPVEMFERLVEEGMLGCMPELEELCFGVEAALEVEEWEMSEIDEDESDDDEDGGDGLHAFGVVPDEDMSDVSEEGGMSTEDSADDTEETDVTSGSESDDDDDDHVHAGEEGLDASMHGSHFGDVGEGDADEWQTEASIQVDGSEASAAEAMFTTELLPGRLPSYGEDTYRPPVRLAPQLKDGVLLSRLCTAVAGACPGLRMLGWDGKSVVSVAHGWAGMGTEQRAEWLEGEVRKVLDMR